MAQHLHSTRMWAHGRAIGATVRAKLAAEAIQGLETASHDAKSIAKQIATLAEMLEIELRTNRIDPKESTYE